MPVGLHKVRTNNDLTLLQVYAIEEARFHLALAQGPQDFNTNMGVTNRGINKKMTTTGVYKEIPWAPLTSTEEKNAQDLFKQYKEQITVNIKKQNIKPDSHPGRKLRQKNLKDLFTQHWEKYRDVMAQVPLIQFISSAHPSDAEIAQAAQKQEELAKKELTQIQEWKKTLERGDDNQPIDPQIFGALDYRLLVEEVLLMNPEYCSVAASTLEAREQRQLGNTLAVVGPLLAASIVLPPAGGVALGLAATGGMAYVSYSEFQNARMLALSEIVAEKGALDPTQLDELDKEIGTQLTLGVGLNAAFLGTSGKMRNLFRSSRLAASSATSARRTLLKAPPAFLKKDLPR